MNIAMPQDPAIIMIHREREKRIASDKFTRAELKEFEWYIHSFENSSMIDAAFYANVTRPTFYAVRARKSGRPDTMKKIRSAIAARKQQLRARDLFDV